METTGAKIESKSKRLELSYKSWEYNLLNKDFCRIFPEMIEECKEKSEKYKKAYKTSFSVPSKEYVFVFSIILALFAIFINFFYS